MFYLKINKISQNSNLDFSGNLKYVLFYRNIFALTYIISSYANALIALKCLKNRNSYQGRMWLSSICKILTL